MSDDCIFCKIVAGEIPAKKIRETATAVAFHDVDPKAPTHALLIPKEHIESAHAVTSSNASVMGDLVLLAQEIARELKVDQAGYRLVLNVGADGGMTVAHLHMHLLGGRQMTWPPG